MRRARQKEEKSKPERNHDRTEGTACGPMVSLPNVTRSSKHSKASKPFTLRMIAPSARMRFDVRQFNRLPRGGFIMPFDIMVLDIEPPIIMGIAGPALGSVAAAVGEASPLPAG
ncbi:MAG: hypothetical protein EOR60_20765 [Mesorhizobium sp.]|nr:MAG: hypothetical protein EOR60_20765 [Mesorhizobium sp.]